MRMQEAAQVLGVELNVQPDCLRAKFLSLLKVCHPDVSTLPDAEVMTQRINEAYGVLKDIVPVTSVPTSVNLDFTVTRSKTKKQNKPTQVKPEQAPIPAPSGWKRSSRGSLFRHYGPYCLATKTVVVYKSKVDLTYRVMVFNGKENDCKFNTELEACNYADAHMEEFFSEN